MSLDRKLHVNDANRTFLCLPAV